MWTDSARAKYARPAKRYATDLTDAEFALVAPHLPAPSRLGRPRKTDLREVLDAIFYLLRTGCPWRLLPKEFPPKSTVFGYFRRWWQDGTLLGLYYAPAGPGAASGRPRGPADRRHRRQPVGQDHARAAARAATTPARRSTAASATSWSTRWASCCAASSTPPTSRIATGWRCSAAHPPPLPLAPPDLRRRRLPGRDRRRRGAQERVAADHRQAPTPPPASPSCPGAGWSSAPSPGSAATAGWPRTSRP